jgi:hypothetical protein
VTSPALHAVYLTEGSALALLRLALTGRRFGVIGVDPALRLLRPFFLWLAGLVSKRSNCVPLRELSALDAELQDDPARFHRLSTYAAVEPWIYRHFRYQDQALEHSPFERAYRHVTANHVMRLLRLAEAAHRLLQNHGDNDLHLHGFSADLLSLLRVTPPPDWPPRGPWEI